MTTDRCPDCGTLWGHASPTHAEVCARDAADRDRLVAYAADLDQPPTEAAVLDLWAHLRSRVGAPDATGAVVLILDLGWRPAVTGWAEP